MYVRALSLALRSAWCHARLNRSILEFITHSVAGILRAHDIDVSMRLAFPGLWFFQDHTRIAEHFVGIFNRSPHSLFPTHRVEPYNGSDLVKTECLGHTTAIISLELGDKAAKPPTHSLSKIQFLVQT